MSATEKSDSIILGLWPIAGITTMGVTPDDAIATIRTAIDCGVRTFDTAFSYGYDGQSDRYLGHAIRHDRDAFRVYGKVGQRWTKDRKRIVDGSPSQLLADTETSLSRLEIDRFDLLFLHCPDPKTPLVHSAGAMQKLKDRGYCNRIGICNVNSDQLQEFCDACCCDALQTPLNLLQGDALGELIPEALDCGCETYAYWTLMKGLLAGQITRDHIFADGDSRPGYKIFQGDARRRVHDVVDALQDLGNQCDRTVAQLSVGWVLSQSGVRGALVGARRPDQIRELADARALNSTVLQQVNAILAST